MTTPYRPVQFSNEQVTRSRLQQMANNIQWLFENTPKARYQITGLTRDSGLKILAGRGWYHASTTDYSDIPVYFGNFFSPGCKPIVTAVIAEPGRGSRKYVSIRGHTGSIDHTGFRAHVVQYEPAGHPRNIRAGGWVHYHAIGY